MIAPIGCERMNVISVEAAVALRFIAVASDAVLAVVNAVTVPPPAPSGMYV